MAKQFWEDDAPASSEATPSGPKFWEGDAPAASQALPEGVKPSSSGGGRGSVNPLTVGEAQSEADKEKPAGAMGRTINRGTAPDRRSLLERSVEGGTGIRAGLESQERRASWEQQQIDQRAPTIRAAARPKVDTDENAGKDFSLSAIGSNPIGRAGAKLVAGAAQGIGGTAQAVGDLTGIDTLARAGKATAEGAEAFQKGMGKPGEVEGFGPNSPVPYLQEQAEGAASSLGQSAVLAAGLGSKAVIPMQAILQGGQSYNEARQAGMDPATALARAIPQGAFEAIGEKFQGLDKVAGAMGTLLNKGAGSAAKRTAADVLVRAGIREIPGEVLTYLGQTGTDLIPGLSPNPQITMQQFLEGLRDTVVQSAMMGGAMAGGGHVAGGAANRAPQMTAAELARSKGFLVPEAPATPAQAPGAAVAPPDALAAQPSDAPGAVAPPAAAPVAPVAAPAAPVVAPPAEVVPAAPPQGAFARAAAASGLLEDNGVATAMRDPKAAPKTLAEQARMQDEIARQEEEDDAQADFEAAMLGDQLAPTSTKKAADEATQEAKAPATAPAPAAAPSPAEPSRPAPEKVEAAPVAVDTPAERAAADAPPSGQSDADASAGAGTSPSSAVVSSEESGRNRRAPAKTSPPAKVDAPAPRPAPAAPAPVASKRTSPGPANLAPRAQAVASGSTEEGRATYKSVDEATKFISAQRARGTSISAVPFVNADGEVVVATKGTPEYEQGLDQRQERIVKKARDDAGIIDGDITHGASGLAFKNIVAARAAAKKAGDGFIPVPVKGGFVARKSAEGTSDATVPSGSDADPVRGLAADPARRGRDNDGRGVDAELGDAGEPGRTAVPAAPVATGEQSSLLPSADRPDAPLSAGANKPTAIAEAAHEAATSPTNDRPAPTQAQIEAGNYKKGHINVQGLDISVENPQGSERSGTGPDGVKWSHKMSDHYGYIKRTEGADGEQVDVYVGPKPDSDRVFVVDQLNQGDGTFDEHKVMLGYASQPMAMRAYKSNFDKGWKVGKVTAMTVDEFKAWLKNGDTAAPAAPANPELAKLRNSASSAQSSAATPKPKRELKADRLMREAEEARAAYFARGNVVRSYGGRFDRVIAYEPGASDQDRWSVTVQAVKQTAPGKFEDVPGESSRTHSTQPREHEMKTGPVTRMATPEAVAAKPNGESFGELYHGTPLAFDKFDPDRIGSMGSGEDHQGRAIYLTSDRTGYGRFFARNGVAKRARKDKTLTQEQADALIDSDGTVLNVELNPKAKILDMRSGAVDPQVQTLFDQANRDPKAGNLLRRRVMELGYDGIAFKEPVGADGWETDPDATTVAVYRSDAVRITGNEAPAKAFIPDDRAKRTAAAQRAGTADAEAKRAAAGNRARARAWEDNPGRAFLAKHGIALELAGEWAPGAAERRAAMVQGFGPIFRKSGMQLDTLTEAAVEEGFLKEPDEAAMHALVDRAIRKQRVLPLYAPGVAEDEMEARIAEQRQFEEDAFNAVNDPLLSDDFIDQISDDAIPWDSAADGTTESFLRELGATDEEIRAEVERLAAAEERRAAGDPGPIEGVAGNPEASGAAEGGRAQRRGEPAGGEAAGLTRPSVQEVTDQQQRAAQGERAEATARRERAAKADADAQVGEFTLTGSDRATDANPNQGAMFSVADPVYPLAPPGTRYEETTAPITMMTPDEFLRRVRPLTLDDESRDAIDALKDHIKSGRTLDPLHIRANGKEDGRHRAHAAKELGIKQVPVVDEQRASISAANRDALSARSADIRMRTAEGSGPTVKTTPASREHEVKAKRLLSNIQASQDSYVSFDAVEPDMSGPEGRMFAALRTVAKRVFGHDVVFIRFNGPATFNGAMSASAPDTVFLRVDSSKPLMAILGHELLHALRLKNPGLYSAVEARLNQLTNEKTGAFYDDLKRKYDAIGRKAPEGSKLREELYADIVGDNFVSPEFWQGMAADQPGLFRRVSDAIVRFLDRVIAVLANSNPLGTDKLLKDAQEARRVVTAAMRAFSEQARARTGLVTRGGENLSATEPAGLAPFMKGSKVVDDAGAPLRVFRGLSAPYAPRAGMQFWTPSREAAAEYGAPQGAENAAHMAEAYLSIKRPFTAIEDAQVRRLAKLVGAKWSEGEFISDVLGHPGAQKALERAGYDGVILDDGTGGTDHRTYVTFKPSQVLVQPAGDTSLSALPAPAPATPAAPKKANPGLSKAVFSGAMQFTRDQNGKPVRLADQVKAYEKIDTDERGQMLLRLGHVTADQLKRWKESKLDVYDGAVNNRFKQHFESPGIVWKDQELRDIFKLDDAGIAAYRELRASADTSIARHAVADMLRLAGPDGLAVRDEVLGQPMDVAAITLRDHLLALADQRRTPAPAPKVQMTEKERTDALTQAVRLEGEAEALSQKSPDKPPAAALAKIDEAKKLRANVSASIQAPAQMTAEAKLLSDRANTVIDILDRANDDMAQGYVPDDMKAEARPNPWEATTPTRADRIIYEMQDGKVDLKRTQQAIEKSGNKIREEFDARLAETLYSGRVAKRTQSFLEDEAKPLLQQMAMNGIGQEEFGDYLHARAAPERNEQIAKVNPDMPDGGAGSNSKGLLLTTAAAKKYLGDIDPAKRAKLEAMAQRIDAITRGTRALLVTEGLEKADTIAAWEAVYKTYVPMFREDVEFSRLTTSKRATGSEKRAVNILANVLLQREAAITRAEKNRVNVSLYGLALTNPNPAFWATIRPETDRAQIAEDLKNMGIDPVEAEAGMAGVPTITTVDPVTNQVVEQLNPFYRNLPGAISMKINGEHRVLLLNMDDPRAERMANAMKGQDGLTQMDIAGSIVGRATRWLAAVNTQYNPVFGLVNFLRDTVGGVIHLGNTELRGSGAKVMGNLPGALAGITAHLSGSQDKGKWSRLFEQFQQDGGQTGFREMFADGTARAEKVERDLAVMSRGTFDPRRAARGVLSLLSGFNEVTENAVRLSAYAAALDKGISRKEAARLARELTVDFNRKGRATAEIGPLYAFFNASLQGSERTLRALRGPTGKYIITGGLALGVAQALMMAAAGIDDDEIPDYVKARALIIPLFNKEKSYIAIPLPLGLHVIPNTGRVLTEMAIGDRKNLGKKSVDAIGEISGAFNPLGGGNVFTMDGALRTLMPTIVDPFIELGFNKNFAGNQIEREARGQYDARPGFQRARPSTQKTVTGQAYLGISKALNKVTGGDDFQPGAISPTPERVRYLMQTVLGGVARETERVIDATAKKTTGEELPWSRVPVASRFYGQVENERVQQSRYYENVRSLEQTEAQMKAAKKAGDGATMQAIAAANPNADMIRAGNKVQQAVQKLNKMSVQVMGNKEEQDAIDKQKIAVMQTLNDGIRAMEQARRKPTVAERLRKEPATQAP